MNKDASRTRSVAKGVRLNAKRTTKTGPEGKKSTTNDELSASDCETRIGLAMSNESEKGTKDTSAVDGKTVTVTATAVGAESEIVSGFVIGLRRTALTVDYHPVSAILSARNLPYRKTQLRLLSPWMRSHSRRPLCKCY